MDCEAGCVMACTGHSIVSLWRWLSVGTGCWTNSSKKRSLTTALTAAIVLWLLATHAQALPFNGSVLITCERQTVAQVDPIVAYAAFQSEHEHAFFGSDQVSSTTTLPQLLAGGTSCRTRSDKSLYWAPTIVAADSHHVYPNASSFYYRAANRGVPILPFPAGIRFVSGNPNNLNASTSASRWRCGSESFERTSIPASCPQGEGIQQTQYVTPCWNGLDLGPGGGGHAVIDATSHMADAPGNPPRCPASHPINLPVLQYIINWPPDAASGRLSSDHLGADPGASAHVDFFNGWAFNSQGKDALAALVDGCLNIDGAPGQVTCRPTQTQTQIVRVSDGVYITD